MSFPSTSQTDNPILDRYLRPASVTIQVPLPAAAEDATEQFDIAVSNLEGEIADAVDEETARAVVTAVRETGPQSGRALVAVADDNGDVQVWTSAEPLPTHMAEGPLPDLGALLANSQTWVPHTVLLVDRIGADVRVARPAGVVKDRAIDGNDLHITKSQPGGWSQKRFQRSAEEQWENNADHIVEEISKHLEPDELVLLAGDETMRPLVRERLPQRVADTVVELSVGGRAEDGSEDLLDEAVDTAVRREAMQRRAAAQSAIMDAVGQGSGATGRDDVTSALFEGRAASLLLHLDTAAEVHVHIGTEPQQIAADATTLHQLGLDATRVRLSDAVLRAAAATGTEVVVVHDALTELKDGVAVSLRG